MVNAKKERIKAEEMLREVGEGNLTIGYNKLGLPDRYVEGGPVKRKAAEVEKRYNAYKVLPAPKDEEPLVYTEEQLEDKTFKELKEIGNSLGTTGRGKQELIDEILEIQNE